MKPNEKVGDTSAGEQYSIVFKNRVPDFNVRSTSRLCVQEFFFCLGLRPSYQLEQNSNSEQFNRKITAKMS